METHPNQITAYREVVIGNTLFRVTSVFSGDRELGEIMEELVVRKAMAELRPNETSPINTSA